MKISLLAIFNFLAIVLFSQTRLDESHSVMDIETLIVDCKWANVTFRNHDQPEMQLTGIVQINMGADDSAFSYSLTKNEGSLHFQSDIPGMDTLQHYLSYRKDGKTYYEWLPEGKVDWKGIKMRHQDDVISDLHSGVMTDIELIFHLPPDLSVEAYSTYGDVAVEDCVNALQVKNTYGHVLATFEDGKLVRDCSFTSTYGFVDVSVSPSAQAKLILQTSYGEIYSNLEFEQDSKTSIDKLYDSKIVGVLNNGGQMLELSSTYSNIYLRRE